MTHQPHQGEDPSLKPVATEGKQPKLVIPMSPVASTAIAELGYDRATSTMAIRFANGSLFHYADVPAETAEAFTNAKSVGSFYAHHFRNKFTGERQ